MLWKSTRQHETLQGDLDSASLTAALKRETGGDLAKLMLGRKERDGTFTSCQALPGLVFRVS